MPPDIESPTVVTRPPVTVCVIMTVRNRRSLTLTSVRAALDEADHEKVSVSVVVVDDGSTDGTAEAVAAMDETRVCVVRGSGALFWAAGMALAEETALRQRPEYLLWLNDDVDLDDGFLPLLLEASRSHGDAVVVGATRDASSGATTYSGLRRHGAHPLSFELVDPARRTIEVDAFNGNVVLVPREVSEALGGIDGAFAHAYADIDYGLRLRRSGHAAVLAAGTVGSCTRNSSAGTWTDPSLSVSERIRLLHSPKGAPARSGARFLRRHAGPTGLLFLVTPYLRIAREALWRRAGRGAAS